MTIDAMLFIHHLAIENHHHDCLLRNHIMGAWTMNAYMKRNCVLLFFWDLDVCIGPAACEASGKRTYFIDRSYQSM